MKAIGIVLSTIMFFVLIALMFPQWDEVFGNSNFFSLSCQILNGGTIGYIVTHASVSFYKWFKSNIK